MLWAYVLLAMLVPSLSWATVSASGTVSPTIDTSTASATKTFVMVSDVPSGATIVCVFLNRTNETDTLDSVSDPVNGTWTSPIIDGPDDSNGGTYRSYMVRRHNSAALTGAGDRTITFTTSAGVSSQIHCSWLSSDQGAMSDDGVATTVNDSSNSTDADSNTVSVSVANGVLYCSWVVNNSQGTAPTQNNGATNQIPGTPAGGTRAFGAYLTYASTGSKFCDTDLVTSATAIVNAAAFSEPGGATGNKSLMLLGVGQ